MGVYYNIYFYVYLKSFIIKIDWEGIFKKGRGKVGENSVRKIVKIVGVFIVLKKKNFYWIWEYEGYFMVFVIFVLVEKWVWVRLELLRIERRW